MPAVSMDQGVGSLVRGTTRTVELTSQTAVWYRSGKPPVPLRWVLVGTHRVEFTPQALLCTDPSADPTQMEWFVLRWQLEVTFQVRRLRHLAIGDEVAGTRAASAPLERTNWAPKFCGITTLGPFGIAYGCNGCHRSSSLPPGKAWYVAEGFFRCPDPVTAREALCTITGWGLIRSLWAKNKALEAGCGESRTSGSEGKSKEKCFVHRSNSPAAYLTYLSSRLPETSVRFTGREVSFSLLGVETFTYTVTAASGGSARFPRLEHRRGQTKKTGSRRFRPDGQPCAAGVSNGKLRDLRQTQLAGAGNGHIQ